MEIPTFQQAALHLTEQEPLLRPLLQTNGIPDPETLSVLAQTNGGILTGSAGTVLACGELDPRSVFLTADQPEDALRAGHGRCRYLADTPADLQTLDALTAPLLPDGYLENIAIRVRKGGAFSPENIPAFSRRIRRSEHLAVRALFLPFEPSGDLAQQARDAFSLVKKIRSDMPCMLHAFCFEGLLEPLLRGDAALLQTLRMLASLNDTSLYAAFFLS